MLAGAVRHRRAAVGCSSTARCSARRSLATAANRLAARLVGIDTRRMIGFSFALSAAIGAVAGILITPITLTSYDVGTLLALKGFAAAMLGGMGSALGRGGRRARARAARGIRAPAICPRNTRTRSRSWSSCWCCSPCRAGCSAGPRPSGCERARAARASARGHRWPLAVPSSSCCRCCSRRLTTIASPRWCSCSRSPASGSTC